MALPPAEFLYIVVSFLSADLKGSRQNVAWRSCERMKALEMIREAGLPPDQLAAVEDAFEEAWLELRWELGKEIPPLRMSGPEQ